MYTDDPGQRALLELLSITPSADNSQPWRFHVKPGRIEVSYRTVPGDVFGVGGHGSLMAFGAMRENLARHIRFHGLDVTLSEFLTSDTPMTLTWSGELPASQPLQADIRDRHTNRFPFRRDALPAPAVAAIRNETLNAARCIVMLPGDGLTRLATAVEQCSRARFRSHELHDWLMGSLRFTPDEVAAGDGLDISTLPLPPGGAQLMRWLKPWSRMSALNGIGLYRMFAAMEAKPLLAAPAIACIVGPDSAAGTLDAGQLAQRIWVMANSDGFAVQPVYVLTDHRSRLTDGRVPKEWSAEIGDALADVDRVLNIGSGERLHMAFRIGRPTRQAPRSRRLPLEHIVVSG